mgnify:CR=1 FL=1
MYDCGGDYLRTAYMQTTMLGHDLHAALFEHGEPVHALSLEEQAHRLRLIDAALDEALEKLVGDRLDWSRPDALLRGIERFNLEHPQSPRAISVLLCLVEFPPRFIVELPAVGDFPFAFDSLWDKYVQVHMLSMRAVVRRYCAHDTACVSAIEIINEPDYHWIPDEARIERALRPDVQEDRKYLTELHLAQIPHSAGAPEDTHRARAGDLARTPAGSRSRRRRPGEQTGVLEFDWGEKFDKYVACLADLHEHISRVARDEASQIESDLTLVSGAVTHNNLDYLIRMHRANPETFCHVDAIGLHPYHWPGHDMHDQRFVTWRRPRGWRNATPRSFAQDYFKRFDFLREVARLVKSSDPVASRGLTGKSIWITEFGIPTKMWAGVNAGLAKNRKLFIYPRGKDIPREIHAIRWEDKWDLFLKQVTPAFLRKNKVEAFLTYTMRPGGIGESSDDEHSNFTLFEADCRTPRLEESTFRRFANRMGELCGRRPRFEQFLPGPSSEA